MEGSDRRVELIQVRGRLAARTAGFIHSGSVPARLCWQGWLKSNGVLRFAADADAGEVTVVWDAESQVVDVTRCPMVHEVPLPIRQAARGAEDLATRSAQIVFLATFVFFVVRWLVLRFGPGVLDSDDTSLRPTLTPNPSPTEQPAPRRWPVVGEGSRDCRLRAAVSHRLDLLPLGLLARGDSHRRAGTVAAGAAPALRRRPPGLPYDVTVAAFACLELAHRGDRRADSALGRGGRLGDRLAAPGWLVTRLGRRPFAPRWPSRRPTARWPFKS